MARPTCLRPQGLFGSLSIPHHVPTTFFDGGCRTVVDLADRWPSKEIAREKVPANMGFCQHGLRTQHPWSYDCCFTIDLGPSWTNH
eukprot:2983084-Amphidinium_carterae.1